MIPQFTEPEAKAIRDGLFAFPPDETDGVTIFTFHGFPLYGWITSGGAGTALCQFRIANGLVASCLKSDGEYRMSMAEFLAATSMQIQSNPIPDGWKKLPPS